MNEKPKSLFKSKTAFAQAIVIVAGSVGSFWPEANQFITANANTILVASGLVGIVLRLVSKGRVVLFAE